MFGRFARALATPENKKRLLNVGGRSKAIPIPAQYAGWEHHLLDIDPRGKPDLLCDARELATLAPGQYDAIYCSHNLEHYLQHDARRVLAGFLSLLRDDGFADIRVPDIGQLMQRCVRDGLDLDDDLYDSPAGPIKVRDVLWGFGEEVESSGNDFYAHKTGFTPTSLTRILEGAGFAEVFLDAEGAPWLEIDAIAFKRAGPNPHKALFGIP